MSDSCPQSSRLAPRDEASSRGARWLQYLTLTFCLLLTLAGCPGPDSGPNGTETDSLTGITLQLLVVDDPELASAVERLRGEWQAQKAADFEVKTLSTAELTDADVQAVDIVICPSHQLGPLVEAGLLAEVPEKLRPNRILIDGRLADDRDDPWSGTFELLRACEAVWAGRLYAVPLGSPVFVGYYRADLLEKLGRHPPETWAQYQELAELLANRQNLGDAAGIDPNTWSGTIEPLAPGWAGLVLLARAAPYAKRRASYSTLFDIESMEPLIASPAFVRALEELVAAARLNPEESLRCDPTAVRTAFWQGRCGMALSWPTAARGGLSGPASAGVQVGFFELPGSREVYRPDALEPLPRSDNEDPHVPLLAVAGRLGVVAAESKHRGAAFRLLFWLAGDRYGHQVSPFSTATTLFRQSHARSPGRWVEAPMRASAAGQYAALTEQIMHLPRRSISAGFQAAHNTAWTEQTSLRQHWLFALRIPGRAEYLQALDEAVRAAVLGDRTPTEALRAAAERWGRITAEHGVEQQRAAYRHSAAWD